MNEIEQALDDFLHIMKSYVDSKFTPTPTPQPKPITEKLKDLRKLHKITQARICVELKINLSRWQALEKGTKQLTQLEAQALAKLWGITIESLF